MIISQSDDSGFDYPSEISIQIRLSHDLLTQNVVNSKGKLIVVEMPNERQEQLKWDNALLHRSISASSASRAFPLPLYTNPPSSLYYNNLSIVRLSIFALFKY